MKSIITLFILANFAYAQTSNLWNNKNWDEITKDELEFIDDEGLTPLLFAVKNNLTNITERLIKDGSNINAVDFDGNNVLYYALLTKNDELVNILLDNGLKPTSESFSLGLKSMNFELVKRHLEIKKDEIIAEELKDTNLDIEKTDISNSDKVKSVAPILKSIIDSYPLEGYQQSTEEFFTYSNLPEEKVKKAIKKYAKEIRKNDILLFHYSGVGMLGSSFIVTEDKLYYLNRINPHPFENIGVIDLKTISGFKWKSKDDNLMIYGVGGVNDPVAILYIYPLKENEASTLIDLLSSIVDGAVGREIRLAATESDVDDALINAGIVDTREGAQALRTSVAGFTNIATTFHLSGRGMSKSNITKFLQITANLDEKILESEPKEDWKDEPFAVKRFLHKKNKTHYYSLNYDPKGKWKRQGVEFFAYDYHADGTVPVYQFLHNSFENHFYTINRSPEGDWKPQGIAFYAYDNQVEGTVPIYSYYSKKNRDHFYTKNQNPKNPKKDQWERQGIAFYALKGKLDNIIITNTKRDPSEEYKFVVNDHLVENVFLDDKVFSLEEFYFIQIIGRFKPNSLSNNFFNFLLSNQYHQIKDEGFLLEILELVFNGNAKLSNKNIQKLIINNDADGVVSLIKNYIPRDNENLANGLFDNYYKKIKKEGYYGDLLEYFLVNNFSLSENNMKKIIRSKDSKGLDFIMRSTDRVPTSIIMKMIEHFDDQSKILSIISKAQPSYTLVDSLKIINHCAELNKLEIFSSLINKTIDIEPGVYDEWLSNSIKNDHKEITEYLVNNFDYDNLLYIEARNNKDSKMINNLMTIFKRFPLKKDDILSNDLVKLKYGQSRLGFDGFMKDLIKKDREKITLVDRMLEIISYSGILIIEEEGGYSNYWLHPNIPTEELKELAEATLGRKITLKTGSGSMSELLFGENFKTGGEVIFILDGRYSYSGETIAIRTKGVSIKKEGGKELLWIPWVTTSNLINKDNWFWYNGSKIYKFDSFDYPPALVSRKYNNLFKELSNLYLWYNDYSY